MCPKRTLQLFQLAVATGPRGIWNLCSWSAESCVWGKTLNGYMNCLLVSLPVKLSARLNLSHFYLFIYYLFLGIPASSLPAQAGKYRVKSRRSEYDDMTPNPRKLLHIGNELRKLNKIISDMAPVSELSGNARNRCRKEKNKLASRYVSPNNLKKKKTIWF